MSIIDGDDYTSDVETGMEWTQEDSAGMTSWTSLIALGTPGPTGVAQRRPWPVGHFKTRAVKPIMPFLTTLYLRAQLIHQLARNVHVFHMQSIYIARQAPHLVILLNDAVDANEGPSDEQDDERNDLEDNLTELSTAMTEWGSNKGDDFEYERQATEIEHQYAQLFKGRSYFHDVRDCSTDPLYQRFVAYDAKTIRYRQCRETHVSSTTTIGVNYSESVGHQGLLLPTMEDPIEERKAKGLTGKVAIWGKPDLSSSPISMRPSSVHTYQPPVYYSIPQQKFLISDIYTMITRLAACSGERLQEAMALVKKAVEHSSDDMSLLFPALKSLCISSQPAVRSTGYQLIKGICKAHGVSLGHMGLGHVWLFLSHARLDNDPLALESQLDAMETLIEQREASILQVAVFDQLLAWLPDGADIGNFTLKVLRKCDHLLMMIIRKDSALLGDHRFSELLERYCSSARCALQDSRFHAPYLLGTQPIPTIEARATRLLDFLDHIQRYEFVPEQSYPILVRTICWLSFHFSTCDTKTSATSPDDSINVQPLNKRFFQTIKGLLEDRTLATPPLEGVMLPGRHSDWRFAVGAISIARGLIWDTFEEAPGALVQRKFVYEEYYETTTQFDYWIPMLERIPEKWSGKVQGDKVLTRLSDLVEEIIFYCNYHQSSEMAVFVGKVISGLADALKRYRCELGLKRRFTLGEPHAHASPNLLMARAERMLSLNMKTTVMRPALATLLVSMADHLCDKSLFQVFTYLHDSGRLEPTYPNWRSNLRNLLHFFATGSRDYPQSREAIASYLAEFYNTLANLDMWHDKIYQDIIDVWERTLPSETSETILAAASGILSKEIILCHGIDTSFSNRIRHLWLGVALNGDSPSYRSLVAVKFLIVAFNNFAFPPSRQLKLLDLKADRGSGASMAIALFNDLIYLGGVNNDPNIAVRNPNLPSQHARLVILQWLLRLRSGARHRIFTVEGQLMEVYPLAKLAYRVGEEPQDTLWSLASSLDAELFIGTAHQSPTMSTFESFKNKKSNYWLPISLYVSMLCDILDYDHDWEVLSLLLCYLPLQLANKHLFCGPKVSPVIRRLAVTICSAISQNRLFWRASGITPLRPDSIDVKAVLYQSLTVLISYNGRIQTNREDEVGGKILTGIVGSFVDGLGTGVVTSKMCLEALSLCVFDLPILGEFASNIIERLSRVMTNPDLAIHILEFLFVLGRSGYRDYRESLRSEDYQRVFGVALMYIDRHYRPDAPTLRTSDGRDSFSLAQHVLNMAFYVMHLWFTTLKMSERVRCIPLITNQLVASNGKGPLKPAIVVFLDWLARYTHGNVDPKVAISPLYRSIVCPHGSKGWEYNVRQHWETTYQNELKNVAKLRAWKLGMSIITISSMKEPAGWVRIVSRRPSCMVQLICRLEGQHDSPYSDALPAALDVDERVLESLFHDGMSSSPPPSYLNSDNFTIDPSLLTPFLMAQPSHPTRRLRRFRDPELLRTTLQIIDNTPVIDTHKVGVIYVAPGQSSEDDILSNQHVSPAYLKFIKKLGRVIKPNDNLEVYAAGLNPSLHGPYALAWWDNICQILFHVASFMPTFKREGNLHKKAEIGNDAVKIVWNEGGKPYHFDTIHSAYNLINLVIEPHTLMPNAAHQDSAHANGFFKVLLQTHPSLPKITPIGEFKIVSAESLPRLMRRYSTIACMFCHSWVSTGQDLGDKYPLVTNWQSRLDMINTTEKFLGDETEDEEIMHGFRVCNIDSCC